MASGWMKRGIALLNENTTASLTESLRWFERRDRVAAFAAAGREPLVSLRPRRGMDESRRCADAARLDRKISRKRCARTIEALALLRTLDLESNPLFRKRLAVAWMNRGITLQEQGTPVSLRAALESFDEAIAAPARSAAVECAENRPILACALTNRGNVVAPHHAPGAQLCLANQPKRLWP